MYKRKLIIDPFSIDNNEKIRLLFYCAVQENDSDILID